MPAEEYFFTFVIRSPFQLYFPGKPRTLVRNIYIFIIAPYERGVSDFLFIFRSNFYTRINSMNIIIRRRRTRIDPKTYRIYSDPKGNHLY